MRRAPDWHEIGKRDPAPGRVQLGAQYIGPLQIGARSACRAARAYGKMAAAARVQQAAEDRVGIEPSESAPVNVAVRGDEGAPVAVTDRRIVRDGTVIALHEG